MKIWLINHYACDMYRDKAGRHYWFAKQLLKRGYDVTIICSSAYLNSNEQTLTGRQILGMKETDGIQFVFVKTISATGNGVKRVWNMYLFYQNLMNSWKKIINVTGVPDVILASSVHPLTMIAGIRIAKKLKVPCICEIRDLWPEGIFTASGLKPTSVIGRCLIAGEHWIYRKADALIFTKEGDTDYLLEKGWTTEQGGDIDLSKCHYINNGVDLAQFDRSLQTYVLNDDLLKRNVFKVVYTGTIRPTNNVNLIVEAANILKRRSDIVFLIYGEGNQQQQLKEKAQKLGLSNVYFQGRVERKYIPYILSMADVNLLNYSAEYTWKRGNSSNKLFEYMASGKPVISTVQMGYSIINQYQCGIELEECTPEELAKAVVKFYDMSRDELQKYGDNARKGASDFDFDVLTDKLEQVIEEVKKG